MNSPMIRTAPATTPAAPVPAQALTGGGFVRPSHPYRSPAAARGEEDDSHKPMGQRTAGPHQYPQQQPAPRARPCVLQHGRLSLSDRA